MMKTGAVIAVAFVLLVVVIWWYQRRRMHQLGFRLDENARRITENQAEIERLQQSGEASEQTIADLRKKIEDSRQRIANKLLTGTRQFVKLQRKERVADMTAEERQCLIDYFAQLRPKRAVRLPNPSGRPELRRQYYRPNTRCEARLAPNCKVENQRKREVSGAIFLLRT